MKRLVEYFGSLVKQAELRILEKINDGRVQTETSITDRFLEEIENIFEKSYSIEGVKLKVRTLRDRGPNAPEKRYGADFVAVLNIKLDWIKEVKGFLAQSKFERKGEFGDLWLDNRVKYQADRMLQVTPESFIFVYHKKGFYVMPARVVRNVSPNVTGVKGFGIPIVEFFKNFLICFLGDNNLKAYDDQTLEDLKRKLQVRSGILFSLLKEG